MRTTTNNLAECGVCGNCGATVNFDTHDRDACRSLRREASEDSRRKEQDSSQASRGVRAGVIAAFAPGQTVRVTNHFIARPDHPCFGTQTRTIARVNSSAIWFTESGRVEWPRAGQMQYDGRTLRLFGGGIGQQPHEPFLTIERI